VTGRLTPFFIGLLAACAALGPLSMQIFLPSLPAIQASFAVSTSIAQMTLSVSMIAIALATLAYGPLSDRYGRRPVMILGLLVFFVGTLICILAPTIWVLVFGRIVQAAGGAVGMVLSRAIIRDVYGPEQAAKVIATLTMVLVSAPMLAPAIGGVLQDLFDWRSTFVFAGLVSLVVFVLMLRELQETNRSQIPFAGVTDMVRGFGRLLQSPAYCGYAFHAAFSSMVFFSFISAAPYVMVNVMGRPPTEYGLYFIMVTFGFMCGNFVTSRLSIRVGINRLIVIGSGCAVVGLGIAYGFLWQGILTPLSLFVPVMITIFGNGMAMPNTQAGAINVFPHMAGTASGLSGFLQMAIAAVASQTVAIFHDGTAFPMLHFMMAGVILSIIAIAIGFRFGSLNERVTLSITSTDANALSAVNRKNRTGDKARLVGGQK